MLTRLRGKLVWVGWALLTVVTVALLVGVGGLTTTSPVIALLVAVAVLGFGLTLMDSAIIPLTLLLPMLVVIRVNAGGTNLSLSDFVLFTAFWPALLFATRPYSPALRSLLLLSVVYQASTLLTVVANPYQANVVEWFHAGLLTAGALVVGWSVGREGHARLGLTLLLAGSVFLAVATIVQGLLQYAHGNFEPVYPSFPYPMHKNFVGCILGIAAITAYVRPVWVRWSRVWALSAFWLCTLGIVVAQSRQALVALGVALVVVTIRIDPDRRRSRVILLAVAPALGAVGMLVKNQIETGNEYNSLFQRISWFQDSLKVWHSDYLFGAGLRWWYTDRFPVRFQPPNAEVEMLSSAGLVGLLGFVVLMVGTLYVLWRVDVAYGVLATAVVLSRVVQGQLDLFWVSAQVSIPFLIAGICLGAHARAVDAQPLVAMSPRPERQPDDLSVGAS